MARSFRLPDLGEGIHEGEVVAVRVKVGDAVKEGDIILEVETDKATVEIPSPYTGTVVQVLVKPGDLVKVGFAAESENLVANAKDKMQKKQLDLIVANDVTAADCGIGADTNRVVIIDRDGKAEEVPLLPKRQVADKILDRVVVLLKKH